MESDPAAFPVVRFLLAGIALTFGPLLAFALGMFETWQSIAPPPVAEFSFMGVYQAGFGSGNLIVRGTDNVLYRYLGSGAPEWDRLVQPEYVAAAPCPERPLIAHLKRPFVNSTSCLSTIVPAEWMGGPRVTYVRDDEGRLWLWQQDNGGIFFFLAMPAILLGLIIGYFLMLAWNPLALLVRPPASEVRAGRWQAVLRWDERVLRVGARVWSVFSLVLLLAFILVGNGFYSQRDGTFYNTAFQFAALGGFLALAAAWRWERLGGGLALVCFTAGFLFFILDFPRQWIVELVILSLTYFPALLFLGAGLLKRRRA